MLGDFFRVWLRINLYLDIYYFNGHLVLVSKFS